MKLHTLHFVFVCLGYFCMAAAMSNSQDIFEAVRVGVEEQVLKLLNGNSGLVNARNNSKWTPLHKASWWGHTETVKLLLDHEADVNAQNWENETPLHKASCEGHTDTASLLLDRGANVNAQNNSKWTPLHTASCEGHTDIARFLLDRGANVNIRNNCKQTPLHLASFVHLAFCGGRTETAKLLLSYGAIPYSPINLFEKFSRFSKLYAQGHQAFINKVKKERDKVFLILYSIERKEGNKGLRLPHELCYKIASLAFSGIQEWAQFKKAHPEIAALADAQEAKIS